MKKLNLFIITIATLIFTACSQLSNTSDKTVSNQTGDLCKVTIELTSNAVERTLNAIEIPDYVTYNITEIKFYYRNEELDKILSEQVAEHKAWFLPVIDDEYTVRIMATAILPQVDFDGVYTETEFTVYGEKSFVVEAGKNNVIEVPVVAIEHTGSGELEFKISIDTEFFNKYINMPSNEELEKTGSCIVETAYSGFCVALKSLATKEIIPLNFQEKWTKNEHKMMEKRFPFDLELIILPTEEKIPAGFYELEISSTTYDDKLGKLYNNYFVLKDSLVEILDGITNYKIIELPLYEPIVEEKRVVLESSSTRFITYTGALNSSEYSVRVYPENCNPIAGEFDINGGSQYGGSTDFCFDTVTGNFIVTQKQNEIETIKCFSNGNPRDITLVCDGTPVSNYNNIAVSDNCLFVRSADSIYKADITPHSESNYTSVLLEDEKLSVICHDAYDMAAYGDDLFICYLDTGNNSYAIIKATDIDNSVPYVIKDVPDTEHLKLKDMMFVDNYLYLLFADLRSEPEDDFETNYSISHKNIYSRAVVLSYCYNPLTSSFEQRGSYKNIFDGQLEGSVPHYELASSKENLGLLGPVRFCGIKRTTDSTDIYIADEGLVCITGSNRPTQVSKIVAIPHFETGFNNSLEFDMIECKLLDEGSYFESKFNADTLEVVSIR